MLTHGSLFSATGLLDFGLMLGGLDAPIWVAEWDEWRRDHILARRFPDAVRYDDVRRIGADCEPVDLMAGGFPCKGASTAGPRTGFDHPETVLWREFRRAIGELRPRYVVVENVANILALHDGAVWGEVLGDLAALGFDVVWDCLPAAAVGAPHLRDRVFAVATDPTSGPAGRLGAPSSQGGLATEPHGGGGAASDAHGARADADPAASGSRAATGQRDRAASDAGGERVRQQPVAERRSCGPAVPAVAGEVATDAASERGEGARRGRLAALGGAAADRRVAVEWGVYTAAIERWEAVIGPAPEPLVRRMDDRGSARVERSRLSALGDGVQVQVGAIVGAYVCELERQRRELKAA